VGTDDLKRLSKRKLIRMIEERDALLAKMTEQMQVLEQRVVALERELARYRRNSSTSSKPPSSDIVKPPKPKPKGGGKKRRIGGQPGHEKHERKALPPEALDDACDHTLACCPTCGCRLRHSSHAPHVVQHVELVGRRFEITEHATAWFWCPRCGVHQRAELPAVVEACGLFGPRMRAFVAYLKGACHMSYTTIQSFLADVLGIPVSTGYLAKVVDRAGAALEGPYAELRDALAGESQLNVDETGHKDRGKTFWTWCFRAAGYTVFKIDPSRSASVLEEVLGDAFGGVLGSDLYSAYVKYAGDHDLITQLCLAHLIRDVRYLTTLPDKVTANYGARLLDALRRLFEVIHRRERMSPRTYRRALERAKKAVLKKAKSAPPRSETQTMAERFKTHGESYFTFITNPGVEPTNNLAEQAIRHVVIDRRITQGTRGTKGQRWSERIWTTLATCALQGQSAFEFIARAVVAFHTRAHAPSLLPP
jgi:transposase